MSKAVKDLSIEQTLKTYEEIWLSKVFEFEVYIDHRSESLTKSANDEEVINLIVYKILRLII